LKVAHLLGSKGCPSLTPPSYTKNQLELNVWPSSLTGEVREAINVSPLMMRVRDTLNAVIPNILLIRQLLAPPYVGQWATYTVELREWAKKSDLSLSKSDPY
jgi:hypothetical protein